MTSAHTTSHRRLRRATNGRPAIIAALVVAIIVILVATPQAQQMTPTYVAASNPTAAIADADLRGRGEPCGGGSRGRPD